MSQGKNRTDSAIDFALRAAGKAVPPAGMEGRILTRLASERVHAKHRSAGRGAASRRWTLWRPALGLTSALVACMLVVAASVSWSHRPGAGPLPPLVQTPARGIGAASAMHPAAPASDPVAAGPVSRGRSEHRALKGRARVAPHAKKAPGVVTAAPSGTPEN